MKRKAKQKKSNHSSTKQSQSEFVSSPKLDGPRTRSSNEHSDHAKSNTTIAIPSSEDTVCTRGRPSRNGSESEGTGIGSLGGRVPTRSRRSKICVPPPSQPRDAEPQPYLPLEDQNTPLLSLKEDLELPSSMSHDFEQEDTGAPELVAVHDLSVSSTPSTFVEPRHFVDKGDTNALHNQRRLNKRELKALLKQTKKTRAALDENILATMERLADQLKDGCAIDLHPVPPRPVQMASPPSAAPTTSSPVKRGPVRGRGRKGRGGRRGGAKVGVETTNQLSPSAPVPASWVPLILPYRSPTASEPSDADLNPLRSHFTPWLNQLSEARVHRFTVSMRHILSQHFVSEPDVTSLPIVRPDTNGGTTSKSIFDSAYARSSHPIFVSESNASTGSLSTLFPQSPATVLPTSVSQLHVGDSAHVTTSHCSSSHETSEISPVETHSTLTTPVPVTQPSQAELKDVSTDSYPPATPTYRPRGRGRGRRFHRPPNLFGRGSSGRGSYPNVGNNANATSTVPGGSNLQGTGSAKPRVSRELRGLVTWDAVMAQQRRQQEQERLGVNSNSESKVQGVTDALLAVAHDMIAAVAVEEDSTVSRTRRTRQSSGSAFSQSGPSTFHSDTGSVITASGSAALEMNYNAKTVDQSSTARSGLSTESSSVTSELFTSNLPGFEHAEERSVCKPTQSPAAVTLHQTTKVEHKEAYLTPEPRIVSPHSAHHSCEDATSSFTDVVKYSPISTDQDPDVSHTADVEILHEITYEKSSLSHKRVGSHKRRGRKLSRHQIQSSTLLDSSLAVASNKPEPVEEITVPETPNPVELHASTTTVSNTGKRKRQLMHSTPPATISDLAPALDSADNDDWGVVHSADEAVSTAPTHSSSTGLRRTAGSRSAALPPRKRYKVSIDSTTGPTPSSCQTSVDSLTKVSLDSVIETKLHNNSPVPTSAEGSVKDFGVSTLTSSSASTPTEPTKKRGRGRPSRRGASVASATRTVSTPPAPSSLLQSDASVPLLDRPKREAAAIGFASLVAANLNNSMTQAGSGPSMDSPTRRPSSASEAPATPCPPSTAEASNDSVSAPVSVPSTPRGRGRPPRAKASATAPVSSTSSVASEPLSLVADNSSSEVASSTSRRKRPAATLSSDEKTYRQPLLDSSSASGLSETKTDSDIATEPPTKKPLSSASPRISIRHKLSEIAENGSSSTETPTEVPWKVFVDQLSSKKRTPSRNGESNKDSSDLDSVHAEPLTHQPIEPLSGIQKSIGQPKPTAPKRGRKGRQRPREQSPAPNGHEVVTTNTQLEAKALTHSPNVSTLTSLPGRVNLFKGHLLTDPVILGTNQSAPCKGPLCDLFLRFLNEPDPSDPTCRLAAPIVYLPTPERNPEFYRFVISSYSSGSGFRVRFSEVLLRRLFTTSTTYSCSDQATNTATTGTTNTAADEAIFDVEFPSLCLASVARRLYDRASLQTNSGDLADWLHTTHGLSESELACVPLDANDTENCLPLLDAAIESVLTVWESFAGRRSWLGRRLLRLRSVYATVRSECALAIANDYGLIVPPLKATAVLNLPYCKPLGSGTKKKSDRRALERGAEVIRCLCGFRVEGGHVMVQCDRCASWQHLPCLWWALNKAIECRTTTPTVRSLCEAALAAAHAAGSGYLSELVGSGVLPAAGASVGSALTGKSDGGELPYFCPVCLDLSDLTLEYPRSLSAAMAMDDLASVFSLQETIVEGEHEFWSLASLDGAHQIRTDDYAFINRTWLRFSQVSSSMTPTKRADTKQADQGLTATHAQPIRCAYDRVVIRIYRLWKDSSGRPWLEGGLFLRPYDVVQTDDSNSEKNFAQCRLWHHREVIYDEASRLVLPLAAWHGRCAVLCPSAFRAGRPADLLSAAEAIDFLTSDSVDVSRAPNEPLSSLDEVFFVCDKLFERTPDSGAVGYRFDEISPGYLKVNMRPYCFFRKPDVPGFGRPNLQRQYTAAQLLEFDRSSQIGQPLQPEDKSTVDVKSNTQRGTTNLSLSSVSEKPKGEKLARLVDWLERKRRQDAKAIDSKLYPEQESTTDAAVPSVSTSTTVSAPHSVTPLRSPGGRGRPPRGSRGRGRPPRTASATSMQICSTETTDEALAEEAIHVCSVSSAPCSPGSRQSQISPSVQETQELQNVDDTPSLVTTDVERPTSIIDEAHPEDIIDQLPSEELVSVKHPEESNTIADSPLTSTIEVQVVCSNGANVEPTTHVIENSENLHLSPIHSISLPKTPINETTISKESSPVDTSKPDSSLDQAISAKPGGWRGRQRPMTRRKRAQTRKRTASESKLPLNPVLTEPELPRVLSDSETMEPTIQTQFTSSQVTNETLVPCSNIPTTNRPLPESRELSPVRPVDDSHEVSSPISMECLENTTIKGLQEQYETSDTILSNITEENTVVATTESSVVATVNQDDSVLKAAEVEESPISDQNTVVDANVVQESIMLTYPSVAADGENSEVTSKSAESHNVVNVVHPNHQVENTQPEAVTEENVVDHVSNLEACRTELTASPTSALIPQHKGENLSSPVPVIELPPSSPLATPSPLKPSADSGFMTEIHTQLPDSQAIDTTDRFPTSDPSAELSSTTLSVITYPHTNKSVPSGETGEVVQDKTSEESLLPDHECSVTGSDDIIPEPISVTNEPYCVHTELTGTENVCNESLIDPNNTEGLIDSAHSHSSPVSEHAPDSSGERTPPDAPAGDETQLSEEAVVKSPTVLSSVLSDTTVDPNSTPILDEPASDSRFDADSGTSGQIKPSIVGCFSDTATALLFPTMAQFDPMLESPSVRRSDSCALTTTNTGSRSPPASRPSKESSNTAHNVSTESIHNSERSHPRSQPKDSRSDSRHSSTHSDRASSSHYQSPRSSDHYHSHSHQHHRRHYSRDRRDRSPTSSSRRSNSSGNGVGSGRTHSHQSPTANRNVSRRNDVSRDYNHHRRSPSDSPRSSTSYHRHSYHPQPHYYHDHHPQRYRHHSRKESTRPRDSDISSMRSSQRDHDPFVGTRNS